MQAAVVGVPGTGKTYFMVSYLKKHFEYDSFFREFIIKSNVLILTNIAELRFYGASCWNVESPEILGDPSNAVKGKYTREEFFTVENMQKIMDKTGKKNIILALDEIQRDHYFPLGYKDPAVLYLFAYHRHIGMDIILGTQDTSLVSRGVLAQCEYLAHGTLRSKKIFGSMSYKFTDNKGHFLYSKTLRTDKAVFNAYQSASVDEANKPKNAILHWVVITAVFLVVAGGLFKSALAVVANKAKPENARKQISPSASRLIPAPVVPAAVPVASPAVPVTSAVPLAAQISSARVPLVPVAVSPAAVVPNPQTLPRVVGYVGDASGRNIKYLLSTGQTVVCKRHLQIGDNYIR